MALVLRLIIVDLVLFDYVRLFAGAVVFDFVFVGWFVGGVLLLVVCVVLRVVLCLLFGCSCCDL